MSEVSVRDDGSIEVVDADEVLIYTPYAVTAPDGTTVEHESRGGTMASVWATSVGETFVEVSHLGHGPAGGELVMVVTRPGHSPDVALGALVTDEVPDTVPDSWPAAVDLAIGLIVDDTLDSGSKDDIEAFHQRLLGVWFGHG
ncbi:hypothetical protein GL325_04855 [Aeromicrobium sp. 636]|uniref:Uncharacterized protein n=1 Tax=Aeromicrobium senzhongii TaxID=2663859 RepID=A0A8I0ETA2_9ACTN|nr:MULTISPECIES: hypothetical protein [Aeromicrobium]MBC9225644.1 hypothetical protein [Aeromicrobium senzhongii]MCQ3997753.1 hypothetical protein [Aeromicrobium sp. 636]MTB87680.1 hypothetical protein [Aeromicrobium senzhongii]QNL95288.1 hypothetical protein H9L21_04965 [Aeromicrobium senzhongii]